jgi:hypothetical protein
MQRLSNAPYVETRLGKVGTRWETMRKLVGNGLTKKAIINGFTRTFVPNSLTLQHAQSATLLHFLEFSLDINVLNLSNPQEAHFSFF